MKELNKNHMNTCYATPKLGVSFSIWTNHTNRFVFSRDFCRTA